MRYTPGLQVFPDLRHLISDDNGTSAIFQQQSKFAPDSTRSDPVFYRPRDLFDWQPAPKAEWRKPLDEYCHTMSPMYPNLETITWYGSRRMCNRGGMEDGRWGVRCSLPRNHGGDENEVSLTVHEVCVWASLEKEEDVGIEGFF